jgi:nucleotide-binding universal stress UspA family protein
MEIRRILLPVEFQGASSALARQAAGIARRFGAAIVVLNVVTPLSYGAGILEGNYVPTSREDLLAELIREARKELDESLASELAGLPVKRLLVEGDPALEIVKAARNEDVDLIMMPTHGRKGFRRFLLGSVTAKVLHDSHLPVWTGAHLHESSASAEFALRHVLCGLDLGPHSAGLLSWAAQFAARVQARLTVAHVTAGLETYRPAPEWPAQLTSITRQQIANLLQAAGATADTVIETGDVAKVLNEIAVQQHADLLVVGRSPSAGHLGGTGYAIVRESCNPVLSVRQVSANS